MRRQLQAGRADGILLYDYAVLAVTEDARRQILGMRKDILFCWPDWILSRRRVIIEAKSV